MITRNKLKEVGLVVQTRPRNRDCKDIHRRTNSHCSVVLLKFLSKMVSQVEAVDSSDVRSVIIPQATAVNKLNLYRKQGRKQFFLHKILK